MKFCKTCGQEKPLDQFHSDKSKPDGLNFYCKPCMRAKQKEYASRPPRRPDVDGKRVCSHCHGEKPLSDYYADARRPDGLSRRCKNCAYQIHNRWRTDNKERAAEAMREWREKNADRERDIHLKKNYGLPHGSYARMLSDQEGRCAICRSDKPGGKGRFHVDHCHDTGKVRGLLCHSCNVGIGSLRHDPSILRSTIEYLARTG